jgi:mono/diheme cytochrome c family protein
MRKNVLQWFILAFMIALGVSGTQTWAEQTDQSLIKRGKYLVQIAGCNDCHTSGYLLNDGKIPESEWLRGDNFGWRGPWGTTYPPNLRLFVQYLSEQQWIQIAKTLKRRPPMPWYSLNIMEDEDLRAIYHFIKSLGDPGKPAPAYIPPDQEPPMPYASFPLPAK